MKLSLSKLSLALAASVSLFSTTGATWPTMDVPQAVVQPDFTILPDTTLSETPAWVGAFTDSIGVDGHYEYGRYPALATTELVASGIHHIRDSGPVSVPSFVATMKYLGQHGIKHTIGMDRGFSVTDLRNRLKVFAPYVDFVEPANEADNYSDPNWAQMRSDQKNLWTALRSNPAWSGIQVAGPSFSNPKAHAALVGPLDAYEDFGNLHNGTCNWNPGTSIVYVSIDVNTQLMRKTTLYKPIETTETGFNDNLTRGCSLTDAIIAKYLPRVTTERWLHGEPRTYINVLVDNLADPVFGNLGLLFSTGKPKPQFTALTSLIHLLADPGTAPKPTTVKYTLTGTTSDVHHILFSRRDGSYDLLIYRELPCWDHYGKKPIKVGTLSVHLGSTKLKNAVLYKYNSSYTFTASTLAIKNNQTANFPVTDAISVLHIGY